MKHFPSGIVLAIALVLPAFGQDVPFAQPVPQSGEHAGLPRLGDIMASIQMRHAKLWYAGNLRNWPLAEYELNQIKASFEDAARLYGNIPVDAIVQITEPLDSAADAVKAEDHAGFVRAFKTLTSGCNNCHQTAGVGFIAIKEPTAPPFTNQSFTPARK